MDIDWILALPFRCRWARHSNQRVDPLPNGGLGAKRVKYDRSKNRNLEERTNERKEERENHKNRIHRGTQADGSHDPPCL